MDLERLYLAGKALGLSGPQLKDYIDRQRELEKEALGKAREARRKENQAAIAALEAQRKELELKLLLINRIRARECESALEEPSTSTTRYSAESESEKRNDDAFDNERVWSEPDQGVGGDAKKSATHSTCSPADFEVLPQTPAHSFEWDNDLNDPGKTSHGEVSSVCTGPTGTPADLNSSEIFQQQIETDNSQSEVTSNEDGSSSRNKCRSLSLLSQLGALHPQCVSCYYMDAPATNSYHGGLAPPDKVAKGVSLLGCASESGSSTGAGTDTENAFTRSGQVDSTMPIAHGLSRRKEDTLAKRKLSWQQTSREDLWPEQSASGHSSITERTRYVRKRHNIKNRKIRTQISSIVALLKYTKCKGSFQSNTGFEAKLTRHPHEWQSGKSLGQPIDTLEPAAKNSEEGFQRKWRDWHRSHVRKKKCRSASSLIRNPNTGSYFCHP